MKILKPPNTIFGGFYYLPHLLFNLTSAQLWHVQPSKGGSDMVEVLGVGGLFFRAKDPSALAAWYQTHLGIAPAPASADMRPWITETGVTVFAPFAEDSDYFAKDKAVMFNFRVADLAAACAELTAAGINCSEVVTMDGGGQFSRIHDPEGNPIELWEPAAP